MVKQYCGACRSPILPTSWHMLLEICTQKSTKNVCRSWEHKPVGKSVNKDILPSSYKAQLDSFKQNAFEAWRNNRLRNMLKRFINAKGWNVPSSLARGLCDGHMFRGYVCKCRLTNPSGCDWNHLKNLVWMWHMFQNKELMIWDPNPNFFIIHNIIVKT